MASRMDRYKTNNNEHDYTRSSKNQELYSSLGKNQKYTDFSDVVNANVIDIDEARKNNHTRQGYHKMKEYNDMLQEPKVKKELDDFKYLYQDHENRIYDINSILKEAKENRLEKDELEEKRKLKNTNYNILASLNKEELEKYRKEKKNRTKPDEEELRDLIDTITTKTLAGEIDQQTSVDLLSDLMATSAMDKVEKPIKDDSEDINDELTLSKEILDKKQIENVESIKEKKSIMENADEDFYTRSMDLSNKDFDMDDEFVDKKTPVIVKILIVLLILAVIAGTAYFVITKL